MESRYKVRGSRLRCAVFHFTQKLAALVVAGTFVFTNYEAQGLKSISLAWDPSTGPGVVGYTVQYGTNSRQYSDFLVVALSTTATIPNLVEGVSYFFAVSAYTVTGLESDPSEEIQYTVPLTPTTNGQPTLSPIANLVINEDAGQQSVSMSGITPGGILELMGIGVTAVSSNPYLIPNPTVIYTSPNTTGSLLLAPVGNAAGSATGTVTIDNFKLLNSLFSRTFSVTVNPVNDPPILDEIGNVTLPFNTREHTVALSGIGSGAANEVQGLTITATSSNPTLIPNPEINYLSGATTGTLFLKPAESASGTATINVTVSDGQAQDGIALRSFTVVVGNSSFYTRYVEAESGTATTPMVPVSDANASNARYIHTQNDNAGTVSFVINLSQPGDYTVWCRTLSRNPATDSFYVSINNGIEEVYHTAPNSWSTNWQWSQISDSSLAPRLFRLDQGSHTLMFRGRERLTPLDAFYISNDRNFNPHRAIKVVVAPVVVPSPGIRIQFQAFPGFRYELQASENLGAWTSLWLSSVLAANQPLSFLDTAQTGLGRRFYRVQIR
jgi:hypothetical protein